MSTPRHTEAAFETVIEHHLLGHGYVAVARDGFDRERAIFPSVILGFIKDTQPREWAKLEALHGPKTGEQILTDLCKWMDANGSLATLRHGFKCYGRTLFVAWFKAAHELNPELEARYAKNRVGLTRQLHYSAVRLSSSQHGSARSEKSLDVTLSVNGIPIATLELKNAMTGQTVEHARQQYKQDRDPRETIFEFKKRTLVHFAVDTDTVLMTTRLAGSATHFLPFNKGDGGGAVKEMAAVEPLTVAMVDAEAVTDWPAPGEPGRAGTVDVRSYRTGRIEMTVTAERPAVLRAAEKFTPDWRAWVDGAPVPVVRTDAIFCGVLIQPSASPQHVVLAFQPQRATFYLQLAGMGLAALALPFGLLRKKTPSPAA